MSDTITPPGDGGDAGGPSQPMPSAPGGPPPGGGGIPPVLAAIARARMQPQASQPGMGTNAGGMNQVAMAIHLLQQALPFFGVGTPEHTAVLSAVRQLSRHAGQSAPMQGQQQTALQDMMRNQLRNAFLQRILAQRGGQGPPGGMQPSTPLPGS